MNTTSLPRHTASDRLVPVVQRGLARIVGAFSSSPIDHDAARVNRELDAIRSHSN